MLNDFILFQTGEKKIRFTVSDPEITGMVRSQQKMIYNVTKGMQLFFQRFKAGIFQTYGLNVAIWKDKHYYVFDGGPRTKDMYREQRG